jgi:hypothetical protein
MVTLPGCPFTVFFRPDVDGLRDEVVVELGKMWSGTPAHVTTPYTFAVTKNGALLFTQTVPKHWWWARWRWQSSVRPFARTAASLIADKHFLPYTSSYLYGYSAWSTNYTYAGPMDLAGLTAAQGTTGDRPEIGPLTQPASDYILLGTSLARSSMIAQAEASASLPFHVRDENTGQWLDNQAYPYYGLTYTAGPPTHAVPKPAAPGDPTFTALDESHMPSLCYAPYLFTDDPYYLEELQAAALYAIIETNYDPYNQGLPGLAEPEQTRATAWGTRDIAMTTLVTPANVPSWLNSQAHWQTNLNDNLTFAYRYINSPSKMSTIFHAFGRTDLLGSFQMDYTGIAFAWIARMFPTTNWPTVYQWIMGGIMPLVTGTNSTTGWLKGWPDPYYYTVFFQNAPSYTLYFSDTSRDANMVDTWAEAWSLYCSSGGGPVYPGFDPTLTNCPNPPWDGVTIMEEYGAPVYAQASYFLWRQGLLHLAQGLAITGAAAAVTWIDGQIPGQLAKYPGETNDPRWSFDTK